MKPFNTRKLSPVKFKINEIELTAEVSVNLYHEDLSIQDAGFEGEDAAKLKEQLNSGVAELAIVEVVACALTEDGRDSLGACVLFGHADAHNIIRDNGMVENAIEQLKINIKNKYELLQKALAKN